jgi:RND family efflux transporter MFP subunit
MWRKAGIIALVVIVLAVVAAIIYQQSSGKGGFKFSIGKPKKTEDKEPNFEAARTGDLVITVEATGATEPISDIAVMSEATGRITEFMVQEGDAVKTGDVICKLDQSNQVLLVRDGELGVERSRIAYEEAKAGSSTSQRSSLASSVDNAQTALANAQTQLDTANSAYSRVEYIHTKGYATDQELDNARESVSSAEAAVKSAKTNLDNAKSQLKAFDSSSNKASIEQARIAFESAKVQLAQAKRQLGNSVIVSPIDGIILEKPLDIGDSVISINSGYGGGTAVVKVADLSKMKVRTSVDEIDIGKIKVGQTAKIVVDAFAEREFLGKVTNVYPQGVANSSGLVSFVVIVEVDNKDALLKGNMTCNVKIEALTHKNVLLIPLAATRSSEKKPDATIVYVLKAGAKADDPKAETEEREVKTGDTDYKDIIILEGLKAGEMIKVRGFDMSISFEG